MAALALTGCAVGEDDPVTPGDRPERLSADAKAGGKNRRTEPVGVSKRPRKDSERAGAEKGGSGSGSGKGSGKGSGPADVAPGSGETGGGASPSQRWTRVVSVSDPAADHGRGPTYADLRGLALTESGEQLRIDVTLDGVVPARLADREVEGIGVDFFTTGGKESDYQVFLDGGDHGWRGYLQTPDGFVSFPGTVSLDAATITVVLPWDSVGGRRGTVSAYVDWSAGTSLLSTDGTDKHSLG